MTVEFIDVLKITGVTTLKDGTICLDIETGSGVEKCLKFKPETYQRHLSALIPSSPMATKKAFTVQAIERVQSASQNLQISFRLNLSTEFCVALAPAQIPVLKAVLGDVSPAARGQH